MVSSKSESTYKYYIKSYIQWCTQNNLDTDTSLEDYKKFLILNKKSRSYIKNCINTIARMKNISLETKKEVVKKEKINNKDLNVLKDICLRNFEQDEISLIILLLLETELRIKDILGLTKNDVENVISHQKLTNGKNVLNNANYIFQYLLSTSIQYDGNTKFFKKTYNSYLSNFKNRQLKIFPHSKYNTFNCIKS